MNWQTLDTDITRFVPRRARAEADAWPPKADLPAPSVSQAHKVATAMDLISKTTEAFRQVEQQANEAVARAQSITDALAERLKAANIRAERAEADKRKAESEAEELNSLLSASRDEVEALRAELARTHERAQQAENRADHAERRASEATVAIERIVETIRTTLPNGA
jgi:predicted  nucleic acid-binding Zn-ribbon protein